MNVFLEAALFRSDAHRRDRRKLGIQSDARYRFERGVDPAFVQTGVEIATRMILEICGGEASELVIAGAVPAFERRYHAPTRPGRGHWAASICRRPGRPPSSRALGFTRAAKPKPDWNARFRAWRPDMRGEAGSGRGSVPHHRSRQGAGDAACRGSMRWPARCSRRCSGASWRSAAPCQPRSQRGGDLVVPGGKRRPGCSAAGSRSSSSTTRSRRSCPTCVPRCCPI